MKRASLLALVVASSGCFDFGGLVNQCTASGRCTASSGGGSAASGGGTPGTGGGSSASGGGASSGGGTSSSGGGASSSGGGTSSSGGGASGGGGQPARVCELASPWCWEQPAPHGRDLSAVWGVSLQNFWVAGTGGYLFHWNGSAWENHTGAIPGGDGDFRALFGLTASDIWVGGDDRVAHYSGQGWSRITFPSGSGSHDVTTVLSIHGRASDDLWFGATKGYLGHWNGSAFTVRRTFVDLVYSPGGGGAGVLALGLPDAGCIALTQSGDQSLSQLAGCDGGVLAVVDAGQATSLFFAQGVPMVTTRNAPGAIERYLGNGVLEPLVSMNDVSNSSLRAARELNDGGAIVAVGEGFLLATTDGGTPADQRMTYPVTDDYFNDVFIFPDGSGVAVGQDGVVARKTPTGPWVGDFPELPTFRGLEVAPVEGLFAYGTGDVLKLARSGWKEPGGTFGVFGNTFRRAAVRGDGGILAVTEDGTVLEGTLAGGTFANVFSNGNAHFFGVWELANGERYASGELNGVPYLAHGSRTGQWGDVDVGDAGTMLLKVQGRAFADGGEAVWTVDNFGNAYGRQVDGGFQREDSLAGNGLYGVAVAPSGDVWVVGGAHKVMRRSGNLWAPVSGVPGNPLADLYDVFVEADGTAWVCGAEGFVGRWNGTWTDLSLPASLRQSTVNLEGVRVFGGRVYVAGEDGVVLSRPLP
ncbi:MAG: hypothetical protein K1X89_20140 [Myxococcaceae bacterium]|nr:hypothetical protein [Myxococcaceae bacterium]